MDFYHTLEHQALHDEQTTTLAIDVLAAKAKSLTVSQHCTPLPDKEEKGPRQQSLRGYGKMFEFACGPVSSMGVVHEKYGVGHVRLCKERFDLMDDNTIEELSQQVDALPGADLWASIPCTVWCPWQAMSIRKYGRKCAKQLEQRR